VAADIRRSGEHLVHGIDAPASAIARSDAGLGEMFGNRGRPIALMLRILIQQRERAILLIGRLLSTITPLPLFRRPLVTPRSCGWLQAHVVEASR
jgi:hypothetical protein